MTSSRKKNSSCNIDLPKLLSIYDVYPGTDGKEIAATDSNIYVPSHKTERFDVKKMMSVFRKYGGTNELTI